MTTAPDIATAVSECAVLPASLVSNIVRRLGEGGSIPRADRGRRPPDIRSEDLARILIGVLSVADGIEGSVARVVQAVREIRGLECRGTLNWAHDDSVEEFKNAMLVVPGGSFLDQITYLIDHCSDSNTAPIFEQVVLAIGLSRSEARTLGWVEVTGDGEVIQGGAIHCTTAIGGRRVFFGDVDPTSFRGLIREARLSIAALGELARVAHLGTATSKSADDDLSDSNQSNSRQATDSHGVEDG